MCLFLSFVWFLLLLWLVREKNLKELVGYLVFLWLAEKFRRFQSLSFSSNLYCIFTLYSHLVAYFYDDAIKETSKAHIIFFSFHHDISTFVLTWWCKTNQWCAVGNLTILVWKMRNMGPKTVYFFGKKTRNWPFHNILWKFFQWWIYQNYYKILKYNFC